MVKIEIEASIENSYVGTDTVSLSVNGTHAITLPCDYNLYRVSEEEAIVETVIEWIKNFEQLRQRAGQ